MISKGKLAVVAGGGLLPLEIIKNLKLKGEDPLIYAFRDDWKKLESSGYRVIPVEKINLIKIFASFKLRRVKKLLLAGYVPKKIIYQNGALDKEAAGLVDNLDDCNDHSLLGAIIEKIEGLGISVIGYEDIVPEMMAIRGHIAGPDVNAASLADIEYGRKILSSTLPLSFGQSIVVSGLSVVAVEAMEGTDATIDRAGEISGSGVLIKGMRADQDRRYDIPVVGVPTLEMMKKAGLSCLAIEGENTIILERNLFCKKACEYGITVMGIEPCLSF